jgi:hypothetical protein
MDTYPSVSFLIQTEKDVLTKIEGRDVSDDEVVRLSLYEGSYECHWEGVEYITFDLFLHEYYLSPSYVFNLNP